MRVHVHKVAAALLLLGACAIEAPEPEGLPLPLPPPPPPRMQPARTAPAQPAPGDAAMQPNGNGAGVEAAVPEEAVRRWRVARDGTTGCAAPAPLRLARQGEGVVPRLLAEARASGGCRTTFRVNEWSLVAQEDDLVQLRLVNGPSLTLWFLRSDVVAP